MKRVLIQLLMTIAMAVTVNAMPQVSLINIYPGSDIYELEGHSAIRINYGDGRDIAVSYGQFDFNSPNFIYRFVKGETDYMVAAIPWPVFEDAYRLSGRRMVAHDIDMDSTQTERLIEILDTNLLPQNRVYRYNYVKDNCATRPLRAIELALGDSVLLPPSQFDADSCHPVTFRNIMRHYHQNYPWYQFGIDLALGSGIDYQLTPREESFAPVVLDTQLAGAIAGGHKIVRSSHVLIDYPADNAICDSTPVILSPIFVCWLFFAITLIVCIYDIRHNRVTRWFHAFYFALAGITGLVLTFLIFVSVHEATSPNWLYVWLNPLCLTVPAFIWLKKFKKLVYSYQFANFAVLLLLCILWPFVPQSTNPAFLPLVLADMLMAATYIKLNSTN
ncbi:MAG: DUF4105 domain-containing protein [Odoribacter sp.]|nr:DUF4105 domain-containing protein [Odoribacter sp.]